MNQTLANRRRFPRYRTDLPLRVRTPQNRDLDGCCVVIAEGGLGGILPESIPVGSVVQLWLAVPTHPRPLELWAIVRCLREIHHGFEFVSLTEDERQSVREFCIQLAGEQSTRSVEN
jgi:PilZ domain-containing protein